ncbi:MAG: Ig-like domain-containing protein [Candidatus Bathyarchaeia archaeon]
MAEGDSLTVSGSISPAVSGKTVTLSYKKPDGSTFTITVTTGSDGSYSDSYKPDATGSWSVTASWDGDSTHDGASSESKSFTVKKKGICIIATATFGSELSPEVKFLRGFRDNTVLSTFAGSSFMTVFNGFYYSFSPTVASTISGNEVLKGLMRLVLYPLIGILHSSSAAFSLLSFSPELGVVMAGLVASSLIGIFYITPWVLLFSFLRKLKPSTGTIRLTGLVWAGSVIAIALAEAAMSSLLMMASTGAFILATMCVATLASTRAITRRYIRETH